MRDELRRCPRAHLGDVVAIEPGLWDRNVGALGSEDLVLVTEDGHEVLTDYPYDLKP